MADSQVEGMRRAYAEIMLNMAKESAARVLAAERRAAVLAGGVAAAKEDGVTALVRLKAIMEARIREVESQSLTHVKKINQLQEQLHGTQNTVASLQVELQRANTELEQTRKNLAEERKKFLSTSDKVDSNKNRISRSKMHPQDRSVSLKNKSTVDGTCHVPTDAKENGAVENLQNIYHCGSDLAPFMARNKKPELYRNGCTQRIRALKQRSPSTDSSLVQNSKQASALNSRRKTGKNNNAKNPQYTRSIMEQILQTKFLANCKRKRGRRSRPNYNHDSSGEHGTTQDKSSDTSDENGCLLLLQALEQDLAPPKVSVGNDGEGLTDLKDDLLMGGKDAGLILCTASPGSKDAHPVNNIQIKKRKRSKTVRVFEADHSEPKSVPESGNTLLGLADENIMFNSEQSSERLDNCSHTPPGNNDSVLQCTTENLMHPTDANIGQLKSEISSPLVIQSTKSETGDEGDLQVDHPECRITENNSAGWKEENVDGSCNLASERAEASIISSLDKEQNAEAPSGVSMQVGGARCIKYTFNRRKRRGVSLDSTPQGAVPEKSSSLVSLADKQAPQAKPGKQDLLVESPRGDSQLVHVAQQLILLSELKWP